MMLYKNTQAMVRSPDGKTDFFNIVTGALSESCIYSIHVFNLPRFIYAIYVFNLPRFIYAIYVFNLPRLCAVNISKFYKKRQKADNNPIENMTDADYAGLALFCKCTYLSQIHAT